MGAVGTDMSRRPWEDVMPSISARLAALREDPGKLAESCGGASDPFAALAQMAAAATGGPEEAAHAVADLGKALGVTGVEAECLGMFAPTDDARAAAELLEPEALWKLFPLAIDAADSGALRSSPFAGERRRALVDALDEALAPAVARGEATQALAYVSSVLYLARPRDFLSLDGPMRAFLTSTDGLGIAEGDLPVAAADYVGLVQYVSGQMEGAALPYVDFAQMGRAVALGLPLSAGLAAPDRGFLVRRAIAPELRRLWPSDQRLIDATCERLRSAERESEQVALSKRQMRKILRRLRSSLSQDRRATADTAIAEAVWTLPAWEDAGTVLPYLSFGAEVDTRHIIERAWRDGKVVALPRVVPGTRQMRWFEVSSFAGLEKSPMGVEEPPIDPATEVDPSSDSTALAIVPGLAFDANGYRVGYGGGFYDEFLSSFRGRSVGLCRGVTLMEDLLPLGVLEPHDMAVEVVATDAEKVFGRAINA